MLISVRVSNLILGVVGDGRGRGRGREVVRRRGRGVVVVVVLVSGARVVVVVVEVVVVVVEGGEAGGWSRVVGAGLVAWSFSTGISSGLVLSLPPA